jgi:hypothetical protein
MTCEQTNPELWRLLFAEHEAAFIIHVMAQLGRHYQEDVSQMPTALRAYWEGNITSGETSDPDELREEQQALSEARADLRSERMALVETWIRKYERAGKRDPWEVKLTGAERDEFISMLNDRRIQIALDLGITQTDMEAEPEEISEERRKHGILEIDVLGHFILVMLGPQIYRP